MFFMRKIVIGIFSNFVNIRGADSKPKQRQRNSYKFPDQQKQTNSLELFSKGTDKYASFKFSLHM